MINCGLFFFQINFFSTFTFNASLFLYKYIYMYDDVYETVILSKATFSIVLDEL